MKPGELSNRDVVKCWSECWQAVLGLGPPPEDLPDNFVDTMGDDAAPCELTQEHRRWLDDTASFAVCVRENFARLHNHILIGGSLDSIEGWKP